MNKLLSTLTLVVGVMAIGCSSERRVDFRILTNAPPEILVTGDLIEIPAGMAVGVRAVAVIDDERRPDRVELFPQRNNIVGIEPSLGDRTWVIWGINPGSTAVEIFIAGEYIGDLTAMAVEQ
jgi:hypothetical protein